jgi:hypothetical protein
MDIYSSLTQTIPLSFSRIRANALVTGLTVTVVVKNAASNATLLASTSVPEVAVGAGIYTYNWTHGLTQDTECMIVYTVGSSEYTEYILIQSDAQGGRSA